MSLRGGCGGVGAWMASSAGKEGSAQAAENRAGAEKGGAGRRSRYCAARQLGRRAIWGGDEAIRKIVDNLTAIS